MAADRRTWPRILLVLAALIGAWAVVVAVSGGFAFRSGWIRISSQNPADPLLIALTCAAIAATLDRSHGNSATASWLNVAVTAFGIALVLWQWSHARPLWLDEEMIALNYRDRSFATLPGQLWLGQSAPLGWLAVQRISLLTFGSHELALRAIPALFGIATILSAAWIGARWLTPIGSTAFVLLCSFGQWLSFYSIELKHYSADTFFGLFLPGLAVWVTLADSNRALNKRLTAFGVAAAIGHWFSVGALLVLPASGAFVAAILFQRMGSLALPRLTIIGVTTIASFTAHYLLALRYARESRFFQDYWTFAFPPVSAGISHTLSWFAMQLEPFAMKPGGTGLWLSFWLTAALGFGLATRKRLGVVAALVLLSAFMLTALRVVPFYERLSLWFLPSIYLGIALFADSAAMFAGGFQHTIRWSHAGATVGIAMVTFQLCGDLLRRGFDDVATARPPDMNRYVDDRSAISWLMDQREPGDTFITTRLGQPAVWWYGGLPISRTESSPSTDRELLVAEHRSERDCNQTLQAALQGRSRVLLYFGFEDYPKWFDDVALRDLTQLGTIVALRQFGTISRAAVIDLRLRAAGTHASWADPDSIPRNCLALQPAAAW